MKCVSRQLVWNLVQTRDLYKWPKYSALLEGVYMKITSSIKNWPTVVIGSQVMNFKIVPHFTLCTFACFLYWPITIVNWHMWWCLNILSHVLLFHFSMFMATTNSHIQLRCYWECLEEQLENLKNHLGKMMGTLLRTRKKKQKNLSSSYSPCPNRKTKTVIINLFVTIWAWADGKGTNRGTMYYDS
jgi:hypothetical protein